jgi:hypothetical protein
MAITRLAINHAALTSGVPVWPVEQWLGTHEETGS